jgi:hypothetical protein
LIVKRKQASSQQRRKRRRRLRRVDEEQGTYLPPGSGPNAAGLTGLQQRVGNRAVQRMLVQRKEKKAEVEAEEPKAIRPVSARLLSGPHWLKLFPASNELKDLLPGFRLRVQRFIDAVEDADGEVEILSTKHPPELAHLMHWAWRIVNENYDPQRVPAMDSLNIHWWHGDEQASKEAAQAMVEAFGIDELEVRPPLESRHVQGNAVDMHIFWKGDLEIEDAQGNKLIVIGGPRNGTNKELIKIAKSYGVIHFPYATKDEFHWSTDGK